MNTATGIQTIVYYGTSITSSHIEPLQPREMGEIMSMVRGQTGNLKEEIRRLHNIRRLDQNAYRRAKTVLPFICGATFRDDIRKADNFQSIHSFVLDFDNCGSTKDDLVIIKEQLARRPDTWFCYISPSSKGIKAGFMLREPITCTKTYADFYKAFASKVARSLGLSDKVDLQCHDVARVSFLSYDPEAYFNSEAQPVNPDDHLVTLFPTQPVQTSPTDSGAAKEADPERSAAGSTPDNYNEILAILNPRYQRAKEKPMPFVPDMLDHVRPIIEKSVAQYDIKVQEVIPIQYGLKYRFIRGIHLAELNIFYGKKGFSVVISPKRDTHPGLNELVHRLVFCELHEINLSTETIKYVL